MNSDADRPPSEASTPSPRSPQDLRAAIARGLQDAETAELETSCSERDISLRKLIWEQAESIIAMQKRGTSYERIAAGLKNQGVEVTVLLLRQYIYLYRKRQSMQPTPSTPEPARPTAHLWNNLVPQSRK